MIRMVAEVEECTGTFLGDMEYGSDGTERHWCEQCRGTGLNVVGQRFQLVWVAHRWPRPFWSHGTWRSMLQVKNRD